MTDIIQRPMSLETEQHLIGAVLRGGRKTYEKVKDFIHGEMFWSVSHRSVWDGIGKIYENGMQLDVVIVGDEMERMQAMGELEKEWGNGVWSGKIRENPQAFMDTGYPEYEASKMYRKTDEQRPEYAPIPERKGVPRPAHIPPPNIKRGEA